MEFSNNSSFLRKYELPFEPIFQQLASDHGPRIMQRRFIVVVFGFRIRSPFNQFFDNFQVIVATRIMQRRSTSAVFDFCIRSRIQQLRDSC